MSSGSDYPIKSTNYIHSFFEKNYPSNFIAQSVLNDIEDGSFYKKIGTENRDNWWLSFSRTKCKIEIRPFRYIRIRCVRHIKDVPFGRILKKTPFIIRHFFKRKDLVKKYENLEWVISETWMELCSDSVMKLLDWIDANPNFLEDCKYCHNPEEMVLQTILNSIEHAIPRKNYLVNCESRSIHKNGVLELDDEDFQFVLDKLYKPEWLFMRKFSSSRNKEMLDKIDAIIDEGKESEDDWNNISW